MNLPRALVLSAALLLGSSLTSCMTTGRVDAVNPTVSELDRLDQQWGLAKREPRGTPKRVYRYDAGPETGVRAPAPAATTTPAPSAPAPAPVPSAPAEPQLDPGLIDSLR